jgi:hypothetical protein
MAIGTTEMIIGPWISITTTWAPISNTATIIVATVSARRIVHARTHAEKAKSQFVRLFAVPVEGYV